MSRPILALLGLAAAIGTATEPARAQSGVTTGAAAERYRPAERLEAGNELVAVFISSSTCIGNRQPGFLDAMARLPVLLAGQAARAGRPFAAVGASTDWQPDTALAYLRSVAEFDEYALGRNWLNSTVVAHVWRDSAGAPLEPQVVLLERTVDLDPRRIRVGADRVLARYLGADEIIAWVRAGAPVGAGSPRRPGAPPGASPGRDHR